jgi:hypothetical protein
MNYAFLACEQVSLREERSGVNGFSGYGLGFTNEQAMEKHKMCSGTRK